MRRSRVRLRRAFAELAVIVAGVLIALWADGVVGGWADRDALRSHLGAVRDELENEVEALEGLIAGVSEELDALRRLGALRPSALPADSLMTELVIAGFTNVTTYEPGLGALADLEGSGLLPRVGQEEIRLAFAELRQTLNAARADLDINVLGPQQRFFDPFILDEFPFIWHRLAAYGGLEIVGDADMEWSPLFTPRGRGLTAMRYDFLASTIGRWREVQDAFREVIALIDLELGRA